MAVEVSGKRFPMPKTLNSSRSLKRALEAGQTWRMLGAKMQITLVGNILVHYKLGKDGAVRVPNSVAAKATIEKYLKQHKAVLMRAKPAA